MKRKPLITIAYIVMTLAVVYCAFFNPNQPDYSAGENRTLTTLKSIQELKIDDFFTNTLQDKIQSLLSDQLPGKETINTVYLKTDKIRSDLINNIDTGEYSYLIPVGTANRISGTDCYIGSVVEKTEGNDTLIENRMWNFERIYEKYGDQYGMYIYKPAAAEEMYLFDNEYLASYGEQYWQDFYWRLSDKYKVKRQEITSLEEYEKYHYATDHHWNYLGAYTGYSDIMNMISEDYEDIDGPYAMIDITEHEEPFYGSLSLRNANALGYDNFVTYDLDCVRDFEYYINGEKVESIGRKDDVFSDSDAYMYEGYYGENEKVIHIVNNSASNNKTLLVFGDSFSNCINEDLAAHFKETYIIDTRFIYDKGDTSNTTFSLDDFLSENEVDCILWLQFYTSLYFDSSCYLHIDLNY